MKERSQSSQLRLIKVWIPPSGNPLLTPYLNRISSRILPLKKENSILSNLQTGRKKSPPATQLNETQYLALNSSYKTFLRQRRQDINPENKYLQEDSRYKRLISIRKNIALKAFKEQGSEKSQRKGSKLYKSHIKGTQQSEIMSSPFFTEFPDSRPRTARPRQQKNAQSSCKNKLPTHNPSGFGRSYSYFKF